MKCILQIGMTLNMSGTVCATHRTTNKKSFLSHQAHQLYKHIFAILKFFFSSSFLEIYYVMTWMLKEWGDGHNKEDGKRTFNPTALNVILFWWPSYLLDIISRLFSSSLHEYWRKFGFWGLFCSLKYRILSCLYFLCLMTVCLSVVIPLSYWTYTE